MYEIWKFPLKVERETKIEMSEGAHILCVQLQHGTPHIWAVVRPYPKEPKKVYTFHTYGTGHPMSAVEANRAYVGTYQLEDGTVWHVFY